MGYRNVDAAFRLYSQPLAERQPAFRVLVYMALRSQDVDTDEQDARIYFAGHEDLATYALGREGKLGERSVGKAIKVLMDLGIIERITEAYRGRNAEYLLNLEIGELPVEQAGARMGISEQYPFDGHVSGNGYPSEAPFPVDNPGMGTSQRYPLADGMGTSQGHEWVPPRGKNGYLSEVPLQEDKKYKNSPYPHGDDSSGLPVDNSEGEEPKDQAAAEPPAMATDYAVRMKQLSASASGTEHSFRNGNVPSATEALRRSPENQARGHYSNLSSYSGRGLSSKNVQNPEPGQVPAEDRAAIELLTADGTDLALATDMLAYAKNDPETKAAHARIRHAKYREQLRSAVLNERNRQHTAAAKAAGPCPHGELGGLVPTRAGTPTCVSCRAETRHHRETA